MKIRNVTYLALISLLLVCLAFSGGCGKAGDAIKKAEAAIKDAKAADTAKCATDEIKSAEDLLAKAKRDNQCWYFKDAEKKANSAANQARQAAEKAKGCVKPALEKPKPTELLPPLPETPSVLKDINFDFDKSGLTEKALAIMKENAKWIKEHPDTKIQIEGNCDERGTDEYNIALGQRRAESGKKYLIDFGIAKGRLSTISYGESKPLDPGHDEAAWAKNRRDHFVVK